MRLVFLGPPGSGKGSQAKFVVERYGVAHISTGDLLRAAVKAGTELGLKASELMQKGNLVPDELVTELIAQHLDAGDLWSNFLLDGFPRSINQAEGLAAMLEQRNSPLTMVVHLHVEHSALVKRLSGRRTCIKCGEIYNVYFNPPKVAGLCDCERAGELMQRDDDNEKSIVNRLSVYDENTKPLLAYYEQSGLLRTVDASGELAGIAQQVEQVLGNQQTGSV
ncbi:MAG: adenylate kinase [Acidiferrobacterales bacterium]|nr:adenylate kinase [Acidiferrobacterales bacterium]